MTLFDRTQFANDDEDEVGIFMDGFGQALVVWVSMQNRTNITVRDAMQAFNTDKGCVLEAVNASSWLYVVGDEGDDPAEIVLHTDGE